MKKQVTEALALCLDRIEAGEPIESVLSSYPQLREDLAPLVAAAGAVRELPPKPVRPEFRRQLQLTLGELERQRAESSRSLWGVSIPRPTLARAAALAVAALLVFTVLLAPAAASSTPGDPLYPLGQLVHRVVGLLGGAAISPSQPAPRQPPATSDEPPPRAPGQSLPPGVFTPTLVRRNTSATRPPAGHLSDSVGRLESGAPAGSVAARGTSVSPAAPVGPIPTQSGPAIAPTASPQRPTELAPPTASPDLQPGATEPPTATRSHETPVRPPHTAVPTATSAAPATVTLEPAPDPTPSSPLPTVTALPGSVGISGFVKHDDGSASGTPLAGASVLVFYRSAIECPGGPAGPTVGSPILATTTDSTGAYSVTVSPGEYMVAAEGGPQCLARVWHVGPSEHGAANPCSGLVLRLLSDGQTAQFTNILYESIAGCPTETPAATLPENQ